MSPLETPDRGPILTRNTEWLSGSAACAELAALGSQGPLGALDLAFAAYLQGAMPSMEGQHGLLAALVSHQYGRGHACLDLAQLSDDPAQSLGWDAVALTALRELQADDWQAAAERLPWIQGPMSPLVLDGARLYLRRNWDAEQVIRQSIAERLAQAPLVVSGS
ncbi:MAG: hypothetical protein JO370_12245, partial [Paucibacter sp.]|nr:hypothetical protein [Roseateles sp.]